MFTSPNFYTSSAYFVFFFKQVPKRFPIGAQNSTMSLASAMALGDGSSLWSLGPKPPPAVALKGNGGPERALKLESKGGILGLPASPMTCSNEAEKPSNRLAALQPVIDQSDGNIVRKSNKDIASFARPLSVSNISAYPDDDRKVRISFKGLPGSYSEDAAIKAYPNCESVPCDEFEDAFKAVELWLADKAVLPIENSSGGSIHRNYDLLLRHRLHIVGEVQLATNLCLLALPGVRAEQLKRVLSHPQALALSDTALNRLGVVRESVDDTAGAAQYVALNNLRDAGVVAGARAAEIYGLNILAEGIQQNYALLDFYLYKKDDLGNMTRYLVLAREPIIPRTDRPYKTSIAFTLDEGPGVLFKALALFALREINLTKIESRPQRNRPLRVVDDSNTGTAKYFDYLFYIDFEASMAEPRAQNALGHLQEYATFLRVLGCYPMDVAH